jgi:hypothetical protein
MELQLIRYCYGPDHVAGLLKFGDALDLSVWALECPWRDNQIFTSCCPDGTYPLVAIDTEDHPGCWVLTPVPGRTGILIHVGNTVEQTQGCILIGQFQEPGKVLNSRDALRMLNYKLNRNEQHVLHIGPGLGAQLVQRNGADQVRGGNDSDDGQVELRGIEGGGADRAPIKPGLTD